MDYTHAYTAPIMHELYYTHAYTPPIIHGLYTCIYTTYNAWTIHMPIHHL